MARPPMIDCHPEDRDELIACIDREVEYENLEYADTYRVTPVERDYEEHDRKRSCCGSHDWIRKCASGRRYYVGCNYGH